MSYFIFGDFNSHESGIIVTKPVVRPTWGKEVSEYKLAGGHTNLLQQGSAYENAQLTIFAAIPDTSPAVVRELYRAVSGFGRLWLSSAPEEYLNAYAAPLVPEPVALDMAEIPLNFTLLPFAHAVEPTVQDITSATVNTAVENAGTVFAEPEIRFTATGAEVSIYTNNEQFRVELPAEVQGVEVIVDCEAQVVYYVSGGDKISITQHSFGEFPLLHVGTNYIKHVGNIAAASISVKERWL